MDKLNTKIVNLKHGDRVTIMDPGMTKKYGPFHRKGIVGTAGGYAVEYNEDPLASIAQTTERKQLLWWVNQEAACLSGDPGYYEREKAKWVDAIMLEDGQLVWLDGHILEVKYMGDYSDMIHFNTTHPCNNPITRSCEDCGFCGDRKGCYEKKGVK